ncbi:MAG TPA: ABC transporter ATP-binding protein [Candidatus Saccharimonadales bacterium]
MKKLRLFTRTDSGIVKKTLQIYKEEIESDKKTVWMFATLIPFSHFLYVVLLPLLISFVVQSLIEDSSNIQTPLLLVAVMAFSGIASIIIQHKAFTAFFNHEEKMTTRLTERAMRGLLRHSNNFFANQKVGSLAGDVNTFSRSYLSLMDVLFLQASNIVVSFVFSLLILAIISPLLVIPTFLLTAFVVLECIHSTKKRSAYRNKRKELQSKLFGSVADILGNQTLVRMFGTGDAEIKSIARERHAIEAVAKKEIDFLQMSAEIRMSALYIFHILIALAALYLVSKNLVSIAALVFTVAYLSRVAAAMYNINSMIRSAEQAFLDASKVTEILASDVEVVDKPDAGKLTVSDARIDIKNMSFGYPDSEDSTVFKNLHLTIPAHESLGLVGRSGGGKSTLTQLLLRYMNVSAGEILIDGTNIADVTQDSLRASISYVPQDPFLFHRSLRDNIAYGKPGATDEEIIAATRKAYASEFIEKLPKGLDTIVGERGVKLSGGQRQRIAIARAILRDAPILILDEATSALDSESEKYIQQALAELMKDRTSIVIAHRLSTIAKLDRIIVLDEGKIIEDGSHTELLKNNKTYASLWKHQSGGFIEQ